MNIIATLKYQNITGVLIKYLSQNKTSSSAYFCKMLIEWRLGTENETQHKFGQFKSAMHSILDDKFMSFGRCNKAKKPNKMYYEIFWSAMPLQCACNL